MDNNIKLIVIDSFCGAGGVTEGFHRAEMKKFIGNAVECTQAKVLAESIAITI